MDTLSVWDSSSDTSLTFYKELFRRYDLKWRYELSERSYVTIDLNKIKKGYIKYERKL